jgi:putative addiction module component (TIGR02574 family)
MGERAHNPPGFDELPIQDRFEYVQYLWDRIAAKPDSVPVPDWHQDVLDQRLDDLAANPDDESTWEDVEGRLRAGLSKKE